MIPRILFAAALSAVLLSGCLGQVARPGDAVVVRYDIYDAVDGTLLRENVTSAFILGTNTSGLGPEFERAVRGHRPDDRFATTFRYNPATNYSIPVEAERELAPIPLRQQAPLADFTRAIGEPAVGLEFTAYGIYTGRVTAVNATVGIVEFVLDVEDGQRDPVGEVGAVLVTSVTEASLTRRLDPVVGATFAVDPPTAERPRTPLGLRPGSYKVLGATADLLQFSFSPDPNHDLIGRSVRVAGTLVALAAPDEPVPTEGNFGVRPSSPMVSRDPSVVLGQPGPTGDGHGDHTH